MPAGIDDTGEQEKDPCVHHRAGAVTEASGNDAVAYLDPMAMLFLAQALIAAAAANHSPEADDLLQQVLALPTYGEIAEKAKNTRRRIALQSFRDGERGALRMDEVMYCLEELKKFQDLSQAQLAPILMGIPTFGQKGLPVNDPSQNYQLRSLAGEFTAL